MRLKHYQAKADPDFKRVLHIDRLGRFGNYFFVHGWQTVGETRRLKFRYRLPSVSEPQLPEFEFYSPAEEALVKYTKAPQDILLESRFLHFFWIDDGYRIEICAELPVVAELLSDPHEVESLITQRIPTCVDQDVDYFFASIASTGDTKIWRNRFVLEILPSLSADKRTSFFLQAAACTGWKAVEANFCTHLGRLNRMERAEAQVKFYSQPILASSREYLGNDLLERFEEGVANLPQLISIGTFRIAFRCLHKISPAKAFRFAQVYSENNNFSRQEIALEFLEFFPANAKWWMKAILENSHLGDEQVAEAFNAASTSAHCQNQPDFAEFCHKLAIQICPKSQSVSWNMGLSAIERGDVSAAHSAFRMVTRHYPNHSLSTRWPSYQGIAWPHRAMPVEGYRLPEGMEKWPRISIVTPSYNQAAFIEETLLSVLNQNYPNLQYIVIDGASSDGTAEILERYRPRLDFLVMERDNGQTEAINKGLRLVDGDIIAWLNSDDMYGPGALHQVALAWMESRADLLAGICCEHKDRQILLLNKPASRNAGFNLPQLARIFRYWLKGYYFYQPEVFFTKRILDQVGLLDESLYYAMDYDLWMRFSRAGANLETLDWPAAFFRKHDSQKTYNLTDTIEEQARVRSRHHDLQPSEERRAHIDRMLAPLRCKKPLRVGVLTKRINKIFSKNMQGELDLFCGPDVVCHLSDDERDPQIASSEIIILLVHVLNDLETIRHLRDVNPNRPIVGWFWDNHHHLFENHAVAEALDVVIPGHAIYGEYLRNDHTLYAGHVPLCVTQWTQQDTAGWFEKFGSMERSSALYGGFVDYAFEPNRTAFLRQAIDSIPGNALKILSEANLAEYFDRSEEERFHEWCSHQVSLVLPLRNDLSQRVFDALLAGQIPLVPEEIRDLDLVIPPEMQEKLPVLRFSMRDVHSCQRAYERALSLMTLEGQAGCFRRHQFALHRFTFSQTLKVVIANAIESGKS